jgi:hypothetical protein
MADFDGERGDRRTSILSLAACSYSKPVAA